MSIDIEKYLEKRLGMPHARKRLLVEQEFEHNICGPASGFCHLENWYSFHSIVKNTLRLFGLYQRGVRNTLKTQVKHEYYSFQNLPEEFNGYTILQLSALHIDMADETRDKIIELVENLDYDLCVFTGDYRKNTYGDIEKTLFGMKAVSVVLKQPMYAILGNHDSIRMVPELESMGMRFLINESVEIKKNNSSFYLAGVDDAHYFKADNIDKAVSSIPVDAFTLLLSHTPEMYQKAEDYPIDLFLCGHTHGGQICLPGRIPLTWDADCPRRYAKGRWQHKHMAGYTSSGAGTSIVNVRFNCPGEVTLHHLGMCKATHNK